MKKVLLCAVLALVSLPCIAQGGRVFIDSNGNGTYDRGEKLFKNVAVSNGIDVVLTDSRGEFHFDNGGTRRFIFITTPSGYSISGDYYLPYDSTSTQKRYDFGLQPFDRSAKDGSHSFIHITDTEIFNTENHDDWVGGIRDYARNSRASFVVHTGDICYEKGLNSHKKLMNDGNMGLPVRYCVGNHDYVDGEYGEELFEKNFGPIYYSFDVGNIHYIVTPMPYGDRKVGFLKSDLVQWLANDISVGARGKKIVVFNHDLLASGDKFVYESQGRTVDLNKAGLIAWIYGHWHINYVKMVGDVVAITTSSPDKGGIDHSVGALRRVDVSNEGVASSLIYPYIDKNVVVSGVLEKNGGLEISVNAYNTGAGVRSVYANVEGGVKHQLSSNSDWNYSGVINGVGDSVYVEVTFADGKVRKVVEAVGGRLKWVENVGSNIYLTSPVVENDVVYIACVDENLAGKAKVVAYKAENGELLWSRMVRNSVKNSIAVCAGRVFAQDAQGWLYAMDCKTGELVWEKKLRVNALPSLIEGLTAKDGVVYAGTGKGLTAIKPSGEVLWTNEDWGQHEGTTSTIAVGAGAVILGSQWQGLFANDINTGKMMWKLSDYGLSDRGSTPTIAGGTAYLTSRSSIFAIDVATGKFERKELPSSVDVTSSPLIMEDIIVFGTAAHGIMALDRAFEPKWQVETNPALAYTAPYTRKPVATVETSPVKAGDNMIICGASDGVLRAIDKQGRLLWSYNCGAPIFSTPVVRGNLLYVSDYSGNIYCLDIDKIE